MADIAPTRTCKKCLIEKPLEMFPLEGGYRLWRCKRCVADEAKLRRCVPPKTPVDTSITHKLCISCSRDLPISDFYRAGRYGAHMSYCKKCANERTNAWREENPNRARASSRKACAKSWRMRLREKNREYKMAVIRHYGGRCACCGEAHSEFLSVDHINGDGAQHRRVVKTNIYQWLLRNNFPEGFRLLCMNCNFARGKFRFCPHEVELSVPGIEAFSEEDPR